MARKVEIATSEEEALSLLQEIESAEVKCKEAAVEVENAKLALKIAREEYDGSVQALRGLAGSRAETPLFAGTEDSDE